jgi:tumor protein p53-inducible protein 3
MLKQTNSLMKHIFCEGYGAPTVIRIKESPLPVLKPDELLLRIHATSINRADTLQRQGKYQPPPGSTDIMGLEAAGYVINGDGTE